MDKQFTVEKDIIFYALRYAIGRKTFAPKTVVDNIKNNIDLFSLSDLQMIIEEIKNYGNYDPSYGDECDKNTWFGLVDYLEDRIDKKVWKNLKCAKVNFYDKSM